MVLFWLSLVLRGEGLERGLNFAPKANELLILLRNAQILLLFATPASC